MSLLHLKASHLIQLAKDALLKSLIEIMTTKLGPERPDGGYLVDSFQERCAKFPQPRVLELGTRRVDPSVSTRRDSWVPNAREYVGTDIQSGLDVDLVADVHKLAEIVGEEQFDIIISCSTFEHYKYPHLAAHQIMRSLKIGGLLFVHTHQTFPLHAYPYDYFRFSKEALEGMFPTSMGMRVIGSNYEFPSRIIGRHDIGASRMPAYMYVFLFAEKISQTPTHFAYELD